MKVTYCFGGVEMKVCRTLVLLLVLVVCVGNVKAAAYVDEILFGSDPVPAASMTAHNFVVAQPTVYINPTDMTCIRYSEIRWDFAVPAAGLYTATFHVEDYETVGPTRGRAYFGFDVATDGWNPSDELTVASVDTGALTKTYDPVYLPAGANRFIVVAGAEEYYTIDFDAHITPEPATMLLLGSGVLFALRRRRS